MHKAGFVNIVGNPNVGKSTLMNVLVGERISIATFKAQTTRHRIMGIYNTDDMQIVFSDTPGVLKPNYKLQESMLNFSTSALTDADIRPTSTSLRPCYSLSTFTTITASVPEPDSTTRISPHRSGTTAAAGKREECCRICGPYGSGKPSIPQITARTLRGTTDIAGLQKIYQILGSQYIVDI